MQKPSSCIATPSCATCGGRYSKSPAVTSTVCSVLIFFRILSGASGSSDKSDWVDSFQRRLPMPWSRKRHRIKVRPDAPPGAANDTITSSSRAYGKKNCRSKRSAAGT